VADAVAPLTPVVVDVCGNNIPAVLESVVDSPDPLVCAGSRVYNYSYTDCSGNVVYWSYVYTISDPVITVTCPPDQTFDALPGDNYTVPELIAVDNCSGGFTVSWTITGATNRSGTGTDASGFFAVGISTITWEVTDQCGNVHTCNTLVEVVMPGVLCPASIAVCADAGMQLLSGSGEDPLGGVFSGNGVVESGGLYYFNPTAGVGPHILTYSWTNPGGYVGTCTFEATVYSLPEFSATVSQHPLCHDASDGIIDLTFTSGSPNYLIDWGAGSIVSTTANATINNLYHGIYEITATDANGCSYESSVELINPSEVTASATATDVTCNGDENGQATVTANGGTGNYTYLWNDPLGQTTVTAVGLDAGTYTVIVSDGNLCEASATATVNENAEVTAQIVNSEDVLCDGDCNGTATVLASGGDSNLSILWGDIDGQTTTTATDLCAGSYNVSVTDGLGCQDVATVVINEPSELNLTVLDVDPVTCAGYNDGEITVFASGGTGTPSYSWTDSPFTLPEISGLPGGSYTVTAEDENGCQVSESIFVMEPDPLVINETVTHVQCGVSPGSCSVAVSGGNGGYEYTWDGYPSTGPSLTGLGQGMYTVSVQDAEGCADQSSMMVNIVNSLSVSISEDIPITCFGEHNARLTAQCVNGFAPLEYHWNPVDSTTSSITNLPSGIYSVQVTDKWGCSGTTSHQVIEPDPMVLNYSISDVSCYEGENGQVTVQADGGTEPYNYIWQGLGTGETMSQLSTGWYNLIVNDSHNCTQSDSVFVGQPATPLQFNLTKQNITCFGKDDGQIRAIAYGGTAPYAYAWTAGDEISNDTSINNLPEGFYSLHIMDDKGCATDTTVIIQQPAPIIVDFMSTNPTCIGNNDGYIELDVIGGTEPYTYIWDMATANMPYFDGLYEGSYQITVQDANGCEHDLNTITLMDIPEECLRIPDAFTPNGDSNNDTWIIENLDLFRNYNVQIFNRWGQALYEGGPGSDPWDGRTTEGNFVPAGSYIYIINLNNGSNPKTGIVTVVY
jgi:gliding motility-associated-like protein